MRTIALFLLGCAVILSPAAAAASGDEANPRLKALAEALIAAEPDGGSVWAAEDSGKVRHIQSGMKCLPGWPILMPLSKLVSFPSPQGAGTDVACDYQSKIDNSKLDLYAQKFAPEVTLDQAFARYRAEVTGFHKDAVSQGPVSSVTADGLTLPADQTSGLRTEIFTFKDKEGNPVNSYLLVAQQDGWTLEVRLTKPQAADSGMGNRLFAYVAIHEAQENIAKAAAAKP